MFAYLRVVPGVAIIAEELKHPELRSRSLIVGGLPHQRGVVREANVHAQQQGVRPGLTLAQARHYCPDAVFLVPDMPRYEEIWQAICGALQTVTPAVQPLEMGQVVLDLTGSERQWSDWQQAGRQIVRDVYARTGIAPWMGLGSNCLVAQLASLIAAQDGVTVIERGQERPFLAGLPLSSLPGIDARLTLHFQVLGLQTIGQFAALPAATVHRRFGAVGKQLHMYAHGQDSRAVVPPRLKPQVVVRRECDEGSFEEALAVLHGLVATCAEELEKQQLAGRLIELSLEWQNTAHKQHRRYDPIHMPAAIPGGTLSDGERQRLPIPYRIHSMMVQPGTQGIVEKAPLDRLDATPPCEVIDREGISDSVQPRSPEPQSHNRSAKIAVRTAINSAPPLWEQSHHLLMQLWQGFYAQHSHLVPLGAIELRISEFEVPSQLGFAECMRLDQAGGLEGISPERRQAIRQQEDVLATRYGDTSFRHVTHVDPASVVTERRFQWQDGIGWEASVRRGWKRP